MINRFDACALHQTAEPIAPTADSDRFTYDRYWYKGHARDGGFYSGIGLY